MSAIARNLYFSTKFGIIALALLVHFVTSAAAPPDPLPSWNRSEAKQNIISFVTATTQRQWGTFIQPEDRIAVFDNDGTLWSEQPLYFELIFMLDRIKTLAPQHPEWKTQQPFKTVLEDDHKALAAMPPADLKPLFIASHTGMTPGQFRTAARDWLKSARHPKFRVPYFELVYQPMRELLDYLRANGFKTYIVTGGTAEFVRTFAGSVYGIPPEQVIGTTIATKFEMNAGGTPELMREAKVDFFNDGPGKPVAIQQVIGRRPVFAFGNSDGDLQMLEWTAAGQGSRFMGLVHHTDAAREFSYDRASRIGKLDKALDEAKAKGWRVADMQQDWRVVYPSTVAGRNRSN